MVTYLPSLKKLFKPKAPLFLTLVEEANEGDDEMALSEHIEEFSQRIVFCIIISN